MVEVHGLPGVEQQPSRSVRAGMARPRPLPGVEVRLMPSMPPRCRPRAPGRRVASPRAGAAARPSSSSSPPSRTVPLSGDRSTTSSWLPLQATCIAHTSPLRKPKPACPTSTPIEELKPGRPRRVDRVQVPTSTGCLCGCRSRQWWPVKSRISVATDGSGNATSSPSTTYVPWPVLVTACLSSSIPLVWRVSSVTSCKPCSGALERTTTSPPADCVTSTEPKTGAVSRPPRWPRSPGRPTYPSPACGGRVTATRSSGPLPASGRRTARLRPDSVLGSAAPSAAPQWAIWADPYRTRPGRGSSRGRSGAVSMGACRRRAWPIMPIAATCHLSGPAHPRHARMALRLRNRYLQPAPCSCASAP